MTAAERLQEAEERLEQLEDERDQLLGVLRSLAGAVEQLAVLAGAHPISIEPARPQLQLLQGGGGS